MVWQEWIHIVESELVIMYLRPRLQQMAQSILDGIKLLHGLCYVQSISESLLVYHNHFHDQSFVNESFNFIFV